MDRLIAIGDIHGCLHTLKELLKSVDYSSQTDTLVFVGDYIDRGANSCETVAFLRKLQQQVGKDNCICLRGNHEQMAIDAFTSGDNSLWFYNGGYSTVCSYDRNGVDIESDIGWFKTLPLVYSLSKAAVADMLEKADGEVELALSLRQELAKSSVKKYTAMQTVVGSDDRARGLIQFYGANRTGRYAGRLIQVQNLPQNHLPDLDIARALVRSGNTDAVEMLYDSVPLVLSELIRTTFVPKPGCRFYVADFSAIEARVIAWIAGEHWRQEVFAKGGDIYCASASQMFHVPVEKHGVNGHLRQKGKIAELALGYGGSVGALKAMGALNYGLQEEELKPLVDAWRLSNPHITKFWWDVDKAASTCVRERTATETHGIRFYYQSGMMFVVLPSGRRLVYAVHDHIVFLCSDCRYFASDHIGVKAYCAQHLAGEDFERFFWNPLSGTLGFTFGLECSAIPVMLFAVSDALICVAAQSAANQPRKN